MIPYLSELMIVEKLEMEMKDIIVRLEDFNQKIDCDLGEKALTDSRTILDTIKKLSKFMDNAVKANSSKEEVKNAKNSIEYRYPKMTKEQKDSLAKVGAALIGKNFIDKMTLNVRRITKEDVDFFCKTFGIEYEVDGHGDWSWIIFTKNGKKLELEELVQMGATVHTKDISDDGNEKHADEIIGQEDEQEKLEPTKFGFVTPDGKFIQSDWGTHEKSATEIIDENGWYPDYLSKRKENPNSVYYSVDYLVKEKGYVLLHNPMGGAFGRAIIQAGNRITKRQREFLYDYYMEAGDPDEANSFFNEE